MMITICSMMMINMMVMFIGNNKYILSSLINLEMLNLINSSLITISMKENQSITIFYLVMTVMESVLGLSMMVMIVREFSNDMIKVTKMTW